MSPALFHKVARGEAGRPYTYDSYVNRSESTIPANIPYNEVSPRALEALKNPLAPGVTRTSPARDASLGIPVRSTMTLQNQTSGRSERR